jgi:DNA replication initiation complex subunit (GINS family)
MAVDSYSSVLANDNSGLHKLKTSAETIFSIRTEYFFKTAMNEYEAASQKNLIKMFPGKADNIKKFIKNNDLSFKKAADLQLLTRYINSLPD